DVTFYDLGVFDDLSVRAANGEMYGSIYGHRFLRVKDEESDDFGKLLLDADGLPQRDPEKVLLGDQQARSLVSLTNSIGYKVFNLSFQIDGRFGGKIFPGTQVSMQQNGTAAATAPNGAREDFVVDGVESDGS